MNEAAAPASAPDAGRARTAIDSDPPILADARIESRGGPGVAMQYEHSLVESDGGVMVVTFNRPERRNALHTEANHELGAIFDAFENDPKLRIAIVTGAGDKAFCAGADLRAAAGDKPPVPPTGFAGLIARFDRRKPIIAAVNGAAMGGGFEVALASDIIVAADHATFGLTEPRVGLAALGGGIQRIVHELGPKRAHALLLTAEAISAQQAAAMGLVAQVVPAASLMETARGWAERIMQCSPASIAATKAVIQALDGSSVAQSIQTMFELPEVRSLLGGPDAVGSSRVDLQACKLEYSIVSPK